MVDAYEIPIPSRRGLLAGVGIAAVGGGGAAEACAPVVPVCLVAQLAHDLDEALRRYRAAEQASLKDPAAEPVSYREFDGATMLEHLVMGGQAASMEGALAQIAVALAQLRDEVSWLEEDDPSYVELTLAVRTLLSAVNFLIGAGVPIAPEIANYYFAPGDLVHAEVTA